MLPKLSIVVPSYNAVDTISRTLDSIIEQNYPNLELICVDGESPDGTIDVLKKYEAEISKIICEPDRCQADALNKGFARATGEIYGWLCADDEFVPGALGFIGNHFAQHPKEQAVTGGCIRKFDDGSTYETKPSEDFYDKLIMMNTIEQPSTFWRADVHSINGPLTEELKYAFDWGYWCRMHRNGVPISSVDEPLSVYYFSDSNLTSTGGRKIADEMYRIIREYGPYRGRIAWVYSFLYRVFDLRGFYDEDVTVHPLGRSIFHATLRLLYLIFDKDSVNSYNWNFASRQERGKGW